MKYGCRVVQYGQNIVVLASYIEGADAGEKGTWLGKDSTNFLFFLRFFPPHHGTTWRGVGIYSFTATS